MYFISTIIYFHIYLIIVNFGIISTPIEHTKLDFGCLNKSKCLHVDMVTGTNTYFYFKYDLTYSTL